jgi:hypothetical protein
VFDDVNRADGAQDMALELVPWPLKIDASADPSSCIQHYGSLNGSPLKLSTEIFPSLDAHASIGPRSYGAQATEFTAISYMLFGNNVPLAVCRVCSFIRSHPSCSSPPLPAP